MKNDPTLKPFVKLDADHAGSILVLLAEYHTYVLEAWHCGEVFTNDGVADVCYMIGNIEGRCLGNMLTQDDLDILEDWEEELEDWKECNGGCIIQIPTANEPTDKEIEEVMAIDEELEQFCREHDPDWEED